jgi:hypothetical protein
MKKCNIELRIHGPMEPLTRGTMEPLTHRTMEPWNLGTMEPWNHGTIGTIGTAELRNRRTMEL